MRGIGRAGRSFICLFVLISFPYDAGGADASKVVEELDSAVKSQAAMEWNGDGFTTAGVDGSDRRGE